MRLRAQESQFSAGGENDNPLITRPHRAYSPDASILLVGIRGTGRSTLGLVASTSLRFRLVDSGTIFHHKHGQSRAAYAATHGSNAYRRQEVDLLHLILQQYPTRAVIVCGSASVEGFGQELVRKFSIAHPVIFIIRDASDISEYLGSHDEHHLSDLVHRSSPTFRNLSNFEFYNLSDSLMITHGKDHTTQPSLLLKSVERDFLQLCYFIREQIPRAYSEKAHHSFSSLPLEKRSSTYCLTLPVEATSSFADSTRGTDLLADAIELIIDIASLYSTTGLNHIDATQISRQYFVARRSFQLPIIIHTILPTKEEFQASSCKVYLDVIAHTLRLAPEYLTVDFHLDDAEISHIQSTKGNTKIIGHYFESCPLSNNWSSQKTDSLLQRMKSSHCELARICQPAVSRADNRDIQGFLEKIHMSDQPGVPIIAYNTGRLGRPSCLLNRIMTPITHPMLEDQANGLLTMREIQNALYSSYTLEPQYFFIVGADVLSSLSPAMHNSAFEAFQLPHKYQTLQCSSLRDLNGLIKDINFGGASITAPFKQEIISAIDYLSPSSRAIGAVNTLIPLRSNGLKGLLARNETGPIVSLYGDNTDWIGIFNCVRQNLSPVNAVRANTTALVLGAGGMAHASVYSLIRLGFNAIFVCNRTEQRAKVLADRFSGKTYSTDHSNIDNLQIRNTSRLPVCGPAEVKILPSLESTWPSTFDPPTVIVSCVPSAAQNGPKNLIVPDQWLANKTGGVLIELSYDSLETPLMKKVHSFSGRGWIAVHGLQVLPEQGIAQFEMFTGRRAPENVMRAEANRRYRELAQSDN